MIVKTTYGIANEILDFVRDRLEVPQNIIAFKFSAAIDECVEIECTYLPVRKTETKTTTVERFKGMKRPRRNDRI